MVADTAPNDAIFDIDALTVEGQNAQLTHRTPFRVPDDGRAHRVMGTFAKSTLAVRTAHGSNAWPITRNQFAAARRRRTVHLRQRSGVLPRGSRCPRTIRVAQVDHPYIRAWGRDGSSHHYIQQEVEKARQMQAPQDAIHERDGVGRGR